jgi:hypothetical protein
LRQTEADRSEGEGWNSSPKQAIIVQMQAAPIMAGSLWVRSGRTCANSARQKVVYNATSVRAAVKRLRRQGPQFYRKRSAEQAIVETLAMLAEGNCISNPAAVAPNNRVVLRLRQSYRIGWGGPLNLADRVKRMANAVDPSAEDA